MPRSRTALLASANSLLVQNRSDIFTLASSFQIEFWSHLSFETFAHMEVLDNLERHCGIRTEVTSGGFI